MLLESISLFSTLSTSCSELYPVIIDYALFPDPPIKKSHFEPFDMMPGAYQVTNWDFDNLSPQEFERKIREIPKYKLHYGGRCGWTALIRAFGANNLPLISWMVSQPFDPLSVAQDLIHRCTCCECPRNLVEAAGEKLWNTYFTKMSFEARDILLPFLLF